MLPLTTTATMSRHCDPVFPASNFALPRHVPAVGEMVDERKKVVKTHRAWNGNLWDLTSPRGETQTLVMDTAGAFLQVRHGQGTECNCISPLIKPLPIKSIVRSRPFGPERTEPIVTNCQFDEIRHLRLLYFRKKNRAVLITPWNNMMMATTLAESDGRDRKWS